MKPKVAIIQRPTGLATDFDDFRDALAAIFRNELDLDALTYDSVWDLEEALKKGDISLDEFALVFVNNWEINELEKLGSLHYIGIYPNKYDDDFNRSKVEEENPGENVTVLENVLGFISEPEIELAKRQKQRFLERQERRKVADEVEMLDCVYRNNYSGENEDEHVLGVSGSIDDRVVAEYIRCRLLPGSEVKKEFDMALPKREIKLRDLGETYIRNLQRIKALTPEERKKLITTFRENRGIFNNSRTSVSMGENVGGFAIDPKTFESLQTLQYGLHKAAALFLSQRLAIYEEYKTGKSFVNNHDIEPRLISGFIYPNIFEVPVVQLWPWSHPCENLRKVGEYLIKKREILPVDVDGNIIDKNYEKPKE